MAIVHRHRRLVRSTLMILAASLLVWLVGSSSAQEFPADVTRGKTVYERHCVSCHGISGWGDGPEAGSLKVAPVNFHRFSSYLKSDEELQRAIEHGLVFSPMHSWQGRLTETEIRDVIEYIRLLSQQGP
jgi:mono/diheme cytochrome c family protein